MSQLTLFDSEELVPSILIIPKFNLDNMVTVRKVQDLESVDETEDYYYLKEFIGKRGYVSKVSITSSNKVCYEVSFRDRIGIFYESDLE